MASEGQNVSVNNGYAMYRLLTQNPGANGTTTTWINVGPYRFNPLIAFQGNNTTSVGMTFQTYSGDTDPTANSAAISVFATITAKITDHTAPAFVGNWLRVVTNNTTTGGTVEAFYLGSAGR